MPARLHRLLPTLIAVCLLAASSVSAQSGGFWSDDFTSNAYVEMTQNVTLQPGGATLQAELASRAGVVLSPGGTYPGEAASVQSPSVVSLPSGYHMYYAGTSDLSTYGIFLATSLDRTSWTRQGLILGPAGPGEDVSVAYPDVLQVGPGYSMYYGGRSSGGFSIFLATSPDGRNWTRQGLVLAPGPSAADSYQVYQPSVLYEGGTYHMWYTGTDGSGRSILYATSNDGRSWTKHGVVLTPSSAGVLNGLGNQYPSVVHDQAGYLMWHACTSQALTDVLCLATSDDGTNWTERGLVLGFNDVTQESRNLILGTVIARQAGGYDIWYAGRGESFQIFRASLARAIAAMGLIRSVPLALPANETWAWLNIVANVPSGGSMSITLLDGESGLPIPGFAGVGAGNRSLSGLNAAEHPTVKLSATLVSSPSSSPTLQLWAIGWNPLPRVTPFDWTPIIVIALVAGCAGALAAIVFLAYRKKPKAGP